MLIHTPTMFLVIIVASAVLAAAIAHIAHRRQPDLFLWSAALLLNCVGLALFSLRGQISDLASVLVGDLAVSASLATLTEGIYRFQHRSPPRQLIWLPIAVIAAGMPFLLHTQKARVLFSGTLFALQGLFLLLTLLKQRSKASGRGQHLLVAGILVVLGTVLFHVASVTTDTTPLGILAASPPIPGYILMGGLVGTLWLSLGLITANHERADQALQTGQQYDRFRNRILDLLSRGEPLELILSAIVTGIEHLHPSMLCSVLLLDQQGKHLGNGVAPSLPAFYNTAINGVSIGMGVGSCGTAAYTGQRVVVEEIALHPYWAEFKELAAQARLGACWSQPIYSSTHQVLGTFAIYHRAANIPTPTDIELIEQSASLAAIAIERSREAASLKQSEMRYRLLIESANEGIGVAQNGIIRFVNPKICKLSGYDKTDLVGRAFLDFFHEDDREALWAWNQEHLESLNTDRKHQTRLLTKHLGVRWVELSSALFEWEGQPATLDYLTDITDRKLLEERIQLLAYQDALTELPNRRLLMDRLKQELARHKRNGKHGVLMFIDLDNFKPLNDAHGHDAGDQLLIEVARRLKNCVREMDTVARFGGDEFVVMLSDLDNIEARTREQALLVSQKILNTLSEPYRLSVPRPEASDATLEHHCSASIGVVLLLGQTQAEEELLKQADAAMYRAKQAGRDTVVISEAQA